jgi:lysine 2,3-aminomutase
MRALRGKISGLCQPDYVLDIPGGFGKAPVGPEYLSQANSLSQTNSLSQANAFSQANSFSQQGEQSAESRYRIIDYCGDVHLYPPEP